MPPDALAFLEQHLATALASPPDEIRRLFHGRGRRYPGLEQLTADWLQGVLLVSLFREPGADELAALRATLLRRWPASSRLASSATTTGAATPATTGTWSGTVKSAS